MAVKRRAPLNEAYIGFGNTIERNFNESMKRKARQKRTPSVSKSLMEMFFGGRGAGKSYASLRIEELMKREVEKQLEQIEEQDEHDEEYTPKVAEITDDELKELHEPARKFFAASEVFAYGGGGGGAFSSGGSGGYNSPPITQKVPEQIKQNEGYTNSWQQPPYRPWQEQQYPQPHIWTNDNTGSPWGDYVPASEKAKARKKKKQEVAEASKKEEFKPEELKGRFCAVVVLTQNSVNHLGILFVKRCGHWKLMDFSGNKLTGGTAGSFEPLVRKGEIRIEVQRVIFDADAPVIEETDLEIV